MGRVGMEKGEWNEWEWKGLAGKEKSRRGFNKMRGNGMEQKWMEGNGRE